MAISPDVSKQYTPNVFTPPVALKEMSLDHQINLGYKVIARGFSFLARRGL